MHGRWLTVNALAQTQCCIACQSIKITGSLFQTQRFIKENWAMPHQKLKHLPFVGCSDSRWTEHKVCDASHGQCDARTKATFPVAGYHHK